MSERVQAILWKKLNQSDILTITGGMRGSVQGGRGKPDLRLSHYKISNAALLQFISNTPNAVKSSETPLNITMHQIPNLGSNSDIQLKDYGPSRPTEISIMRQHRGYTNPRWADIANRGSENDYIYILRLADSTFTSGWATADEVTHFPIQKVCSLS